MNLRELQKQEAIKRLEILEKLYNLHPNVLKEFKQDGTVYYSEHINNLQSGILYWLNSQPKYVDAVKDVESKYNVYVYHCILNHTQDGDWLTMLYVATDVDMWKYDRDDLVSGNMMAYVETFDDINSEFGYVQIKGINGGIDRFA